MACLFVVYGLLWLSFLGGSFTLVLDVLLSKNIRVYCVWCQWFLINAKWRHASRALYGSSLGLSAQLSQEGGGKWTLDLARAQSLDGTHCT